MGKLLKKTKNFIVREEGSIDQMTWIIGSAVVVVLVIVVFMTQAPDTAETLWNDFIDYARDEFGL